MHEELYYHSNMDVIQKGCESMRAYYIPYSDLGRALDGNRQNSSCFCLLNGEWDFCYYESVSDVVTLPDAFSNKITVPSCWQNTLRYDKPQYLNISYPFTINPPFVPQQNPCGLYRREFNVSRETIENKELYINFEGVCSCFYLWINGNFAAYSQGSHMTAEVNLTQLVVEGKNEIKLLVLKYCDGSYLEDQDMFRLSGIFRDVYLLIRDKNHIRDIAIKTDLSEDFSKAQISLYFDGGEGLQKNISLYDVAGEKLLFSTLSLDNKVSFSVLNPYLWSAEQPELYSLIIECGTEIIPQKIGFRKVEIKNGVVLFNGKKIKIKGVNHHDTNPYTGYYLSEKAMTEDLYIMKSNNINAVRTSHYPPAPRFIELCDELGLYVIEEADLETHGFDVCNEGRGSLAKRPEWKAAYVDRAVRMFHRDKNRTSVICWSLGNEAGIGENFAAMAEKIRELDIDNTGKLRRLLHYEPDNSFYSFYQSELLKTDFESMMYSTFEDIDKMLAKGNRPLFLCEYSHAMGNSCGDVGDYVEKFYSDDRFFGGCVWEFADHAVAQSGENGDVHLLYGGDFDEGMNDGNFCVDGLVTPLRTPKSSMLAVKQAYRPFKIEKKNDIYSITSRNLFSPLDITVKWQVKHDGVTKKNGQDTIYLEPEKTVNFIIPSEAATHECVVCISVLNNDASLWASSGSELGKAQFILSDAEPEKPLSILNKKIRLDENSRYYRITANKTTFIFDKDLGCLRCVRVGKKDVVSTSLLLSAVRAPIDNDRNLLDLWNRFGLFETKQECEYCDCEDSDGEILVKAKLLLGADGHIPVLYANALYSFSADGRMSVRLDVSVSEQIPSLPRFGVAFEMPVDYERISYYGYGPEETYIDKHDYAFLGIYEKPLDKRPFYVMPQQSDDCYGVRSARIVDRRGHGVKITAPSPFSVRASRFSEKQLKEKRHRYDLEPENSVFVSLDYKMGGIGSASCGPQLSEKYALTEKNFTFEFTLSVE